MAADLQFRVGAELTEIKAALADLRREFATTGQAAQQAGSGKGIAELTGSVQGAIGAVKLLVAGVAALGAANIFGRLIQQGIEFNSQLETAQLGIASIIAAQANLADASGKAVQGQDALTVAIGLSAQQMRELRIAGLETAATTVQLVQAFQGAIGPGLAAGLKLDEVRKLTIEITQAASALGVPMVQLNQEIRSILDGTIDINSRVAKTLGISNEMVKKWKEQGTLVKELSARMSSFSDAGKRAADTFEVIKSNAKEAMDAVAGDISSGLFDQLKSALKDATTGIFDTQTLGISDAFKEAVSFARELTTAIGEALANAIRGVVELVRKWNDYLNDNRAAINEIVGSVGLVFSAIGDLLGSVAQLAAGFGDAAVKTNGLAIALQTISVLIAGVIDGVRFLTSAIVGFGAAFIKVVLTPFETFFDLIGKAASAAGIAAGQQLQEVSRQIKDISARGFEAAGNIMQPLADGTGAVATAIARMDKLRKAAEDAGKATDKAVNNDTKKPKQEEVGKITGVKNAPEVPEAVRKAQLDADEKLLKDSLTRAKSFYEDLYKGAKLSAEDYFAARQALELRALDQAIAVERKRADLGGAERVKALAEIEILEREKADIKRRIEREQDAESTKRVQELAQIQAQALQIQGNTAEAKRIELELRFKETIARLQAEGKTAGVELVQNLINMEVARAQFEELKKEFDRVTAQLQAKQQSIANQVATGSISADTGQQQSRQARDEAIVQLDTLNQKMQELAQTNKDTVPEIAKGAEEVNASFQKLAVESATGIDAAVIGLRSSMANLQQTLAQTVTGAGVDALTGLFTDLASGSKSAGDAIKDFAKGFVASMAQVAARAMATFLVLQLLDAIFPGAGKAAGASMGAGVKHKGGMVGGPGVTRNVDPMVFAGAPRFHSGGMVGLQPGEVPAILQTGEEVLARNDPRNAANGGGQQNNGYRIVNVLDPSLVSGYLDSSAGERSVLNVISRNQGQVRQLIGA